MTLRVLHVSPNYPGPRNPVAAVFVRRQIAGLARLGVSSEVVVFRSRPPVLLRRMRSRYWLAAAWRSFRGSVAAHEVPVHDVLYEQTADRGGDDVPRIEEVLCRWAADNDAAARFDVIAAHWLWPGAAAALGLRRATRLPLAAFAWGSDLHTWPDRLPECRRYVDGVLLRADGLLAGSQALVACAERIRPGCGQRFAVFRSGCDSDTFRPALDRGSVRKSLRLDPHGLYLVTCGGISAVKGAEELAAAWQVFACSHERWQLLVVGRAVEPQLLSRLVQLPRVKAVGQVENVVPYLQSADIYLQPSRQEGLANATLEAMAVGLPVVSTDAGGQSEIVRHEQNGLMVPSHDPVALARALARLAGEPGLAARLGQAARATVLAECEPARAASHVAAVLERVASQR